MRKVIHRVVRVGGAIGMAVLLANCGLFSAGGAPGAPATGPAVTITQEAAPSALLAVITGPAFGPALFGLVARTARPREDVRILQAGLPGTTIVASDSPGPARMVIPGPPLASGGGETPYQSAMYAKRLKAWHAKRAADVQADAAQTRKQVSAWLGGLGIPQKMGGLADPRGDEGSLAAESAVAASALANLEARPGNVFGSRRVIILFCDDLNGVLPAGELTGADVIVVTGYLPTAADASAAQAELLGSGAAQAAIVGPELTAVQLAALVSADLTQGAVRDSVSAPVLFANNSFDLDAAAISELTRLIPRLREAGATAVINGYASTPGTAEANYLLSYQRATEVADFFESRGIPESSLIIVGHGASDVFGLESPGANRRVLVVTE
jgi:outer membrane protein OmpA-like peptidoglycan-associated protein